MRYNRRHAQFGFTLVELLVVIAIIGILMGMLLPAVQMVRESARRSSCTNNIRQIGIATTHYHDTKGKIPPARATDNSVSWMVYIMPFMEQRNLYERFDIQIAYKDQDPDILTNSVPIMNCPSRRRAQISQYETAGRPVGACGDYAGNAGTSEYFPYDLWAKFEEPVDGIINSGFSTDNPIVGGKLAHGEVGRYKLRDVRDGLTNTIFFGEKAMNVNAMGEPGGWGDGCIYNGGEPGTIMRLGGYGMPLTTDEKFGAPGPGAIPVFGSPHRGLVNFVFGDGSVHSLRDSIEVETFRRLCARNDGEVVSLEK